VKVQRTAGACGATVTGMDLSRQLSAEEVLAIRRAWIEHKVLVFPEQDLDDADLVRITRGFGGLGEDPFFVSIAPDNPVVALTRRADETAPVFAESWHSDWSFKAEPPIGTCLYSLTIPPVGGDTSFIDQEKALAEMPAALRARIEGRNALHTAALAYAPEGTYGEREADSDRSMKIIYSEAARDVQPHPFIFRHPESGRETLFGCLGYIVGVEGMADEEAQALVREIYDWQTREEFQYTHRWEERMLVIWDNRSVLHRANGGYDGYARELHRTTISADPSRYLAA
jgi:taurine dioxygenase